MRYAIRRLLTKADFISEAAFMRNALGLLHEMLVGLNVEVGVMFNVEGPERGTSVLNFSIRPTKVVHHVVGPCNRPPTDEELAALTQLLAPEGIVVEYRPNTNY